MQHAEIAIVGAGPAGLAAAAEASLFTDDVILIDSNVRFGGQYWRHGAIEEDRSASKPNLHHGWTIYEELESKLITAQRERKLTVLPGTNVVNATQTEDREFHIRISRSTETQVGAPLDDNLICAEKLVLCTGTYDRQLPIPGWTLPGVMAAGGVQAFIKTQYQSPGKRVLIAGTGPFLLAAAASVLEAGGEVAAICEYNNLLKWFPRGLTSAAVPSKIVEGFEYTRLLAQHRVPYLHRHAVTEIMGRGAVQSVLTSRIDRNGKAITGTDRRFDEVDIVGLGWGFVPQLEILLQLAAGTKIDLDGSLVGRVDEVQQSTVEGLFLAGEVTGVSGAIAAVAEGRIAGRAAAGGGKTPLKDRASRFRHHAFARALHMAHPAPSQWLEQQPKETIVCRCEEVCLGDLRDLADRSSSQDLRSIKGLSRAGMGYCQGRICGSALQQFCRPAGTPEEDANVIGKRPVAFPVEIGSLSKIFGSGSQ